MDQKTRDRITNAGFPLESYFTGRMVLGPMTKASITKFANLNTLLTRNKLPLPPSKFTEMIVDQTTGESRQDFREIIDGRPGSGKSRSALYGCGRYAIEAADRHGQDPKDYFCLANCALLQDTQGVAYMLDSLDKYQAVLIDDAGVSAGNKTFLSESNRNINAIMQTCRTKRWYVVFTAPMSKHLDLQIRELVYCKGNVYKSCHHEGFNILQQTGVNMKFINHRWMEFNPNFVFEEIKTNLYAYFNLDYMEPFKGDVEKYDDLRDKASDSLIHEKATRENEIKNPTDKRAVAFQKILKENCDVVFQMTHDENGMWLNPRVSGGAKNDPKTYSMGAIRKETGLNERQVDKIIAHIKKKESGG